MILAVGASVLAHVTVVVPILLVMMTATGAPQRFEAMFSSAGLVDEQAEAPQQKLGIEKSTASTFTWIGYEEYQEHIARLAEIDQAAFTNEPAGTNQPVEPIDVTEAPSAQLTPEAIEALQSLRAIELPAQLPQLELPSLARALEAVGLRSAERDQGESEERIKALPVEAEDATTEIAEARPQEAKRETVPDDSLEPVTDEGASPGTPGDASEKQSDPTSILDAPAENWRLGRPLAAEGVELKPRRPVFSIVQRLTASPCNPLVEMRFNREGIVTYATLLEGSRDSAIDAAIQASAYRWRAEGEELTRLGEEDTFNVRIRFILNPYARCP